MQDPIHDPVSGDPLFFRFHLHQVKRKAGDSPGYQGDSIPDRGIGEGGLLSDGFTREGLRAVEIPKRRIPSLGIVDAEVAEILSCFFEPL